MFDREHEMRAPVCQWLKSHGWVYAVEMWLSGGIADIVAGQYGPRPAPRRIPPVTRVVAVELKRYDIAKVVSQCLANQHVVDLAYAAMPLDRCEKMTTKSRAKFSDAGIGLLSVTPDHVKILIDAKPARGRQDRVVKQLWRRVRKQYKELCPTEEERLRAEWLELEMDDVMSFPDYLERRRRAGNAAKKDRLKSAGSVPPSD